MHYGINRPLTPTPSQGLKVLINDRSIEVYHHQGRQYVEGRRNSIFTLSITNPFSYRAKAVVSVDGFDVISGQPAGPDSPGYILNAYETQVIRGFRVSDTESREFKFVDIDQSYATVAGNDASNSGVIAVRFYQEKMIPVSYDYLFRSAYNALPKGITPMGPTRGYGGTAVNGLPEPTVALASSTVAQSVGTGQGESVFDSVTRVSFQSDKTVYRDFVIYYDSRKGLEQRGVIRTRANSLPNPFPADNGYCKSL